MNVLVVAPHPDDETLGCGGQLLRHKENGDSIHWLIVTSMSEALGYSPERIARRNEEIRQVASLYGCCSEDGEGGVTRLPFPPAALDTVATGELVKELSAVIARVQPHTVYVPYRNDVHSDHTVVFDAVISATKNFRAPFVQRILAYETISETDFCLQPDVSGFRPNYFCDITSKLEEKKEILRIYASELGEFPFPRSLKAVEALANMRGARCGCEAAEAFMLLFEVCCEKND